ncbi:MAG: hypothetical protein CM1200mP30_14940 [Pseudomonadota bacterium]|nr:MAG: hypothetical protein CM1200mP30_14940 [Pseudomonadota bacterium]
MKKVFPVKLLGSRRFTSPGSKWFRIKNKKNSKNAVSLLKLGTILKILLILSRNKIRPPTAETDLPAAHSAHEFFILPKTFPGIGSRF